MDNLLADSLELVLPGPEDYPALAELWEASVRATHHFLSEADILYFRPLVENEYFRLVQLFALKSASGSFCGFLGILRGKIEMLFIAPEYRGQGMGKQLIKLAVEELDAILLDVNEQNEQAVAFYLKMGFKITGRSPLDGMGKPYPLLHLRYADAD